MDPDISVCGWVTESGAGCEHSKGSMGQAIRWRWLDVH